ncbi:MAG: SDR family NAD(P)-dependent oxidoreductase [Candidatus Pristimantibacillus lignocellulolyticus]|uniref:SDR family NAD(P)-dependent oxidoreductase n=1 Tax=Candidatus Pristimantibacillus lignocellulolyticus TaxID=2994561 RepID=A0A9J6ZJ89_9BACL|nr:MAG: SDR family NAD(P)-dependent oxidoreductase [Candidatus Pristimantibacillus lignocellulolyticus]
MHSYSFLEHLMFPRTSLNRQKLKRELKGKTVLITGASSGIGEQLAYMLADIKVQLILVARREDKLQSMKRKIEMKEATVKILSADLRNKEDTERVITVLNLLPDGLDIFISNAGHSIRRPILQSLKRYHDFTRTMAINYFAPVELILSIQPLLEQKQGHIINISTINTMLYPFPHWAAYQSSKAAFDIWLRSAAPELNNCGISTTSIYLPLVRTPMIVPTVSYEKSPAMSPQHAAAIICNCMYTKKKTYKPWWLIIGQLSSVLFSRWLETYISIKVKKKGG